MKTNYKKTRSSLLIIATLLTILIAPSCKKALDNELDNATYDDKFWKNESDAQGAIGGLMRFYVPVYIQIMLSLFGAIYLTVSLKLMIPTCRVLM
ncbi:hypothetical protein G7074_12755 [Pedobacter sp. HDW13]|uniref:hypothetical protein n=1 Tax=Pedobacter sp. HDW13 TaxID=2714940 RepID=UPI00140A6FC6|nr:hypothetical protein [Pedobacter sp. HDW13]QIL40052.1 hypothetical protein G7074_12755 [Pedobacter sp. HDW13]